jgi:hypothetical protein
MLVTLAFVIEVDEAIPEARFAMLPAGMAPKIDGTVKTALLSRLRHRLN